MYEAIATIVLLLLHMVAAGGLFYVSTHIHNGNLRRATQGALTTALCIIIIAAAVSLAKAWLDP